jgi:hypothetical protein
MSLLSKYIERQVKKKGLKTFMLGVLKMVAKATPSTRDDKVVREIEKILNQIK